MTLPKKSRGHRECFLHANHHPSKFLNCNLTPFHSSSDPLPSSSGTAWQCSPWPPPHNKAQARVQVIPCLLLGHRIRNKERRQLHVREFYWWSSLPQMTAFPLPTPSVVASTVTAATVQEFNLPCMLSSSDAYPSAWLTRSLFYSPDCAWILLPWFPPGSQGWGSL